MSISHRLAGLEAAGLVERTGDQLVLDAATWARRGMELSRRHCLAWLEGDRLTMSETICADVLFGIAGFLLYLAAVAIVLRLPRALSPARAVIGIALLAYATVVVAAGVLGHNINFGPCRSSSGSRHCYF